MVGPRKPRKPLGDRPKQKTAARNEKGQVVKGAAALNPKGENGHLKGYQPYGKRALMWLDSHTVEELMAISKDKKRFGALSVYDGMIVTNIVDAFVSMARGAERERLLCRIEGAPRESLSVELDGKVKVEHGLDNPAYKLIASRVAGIRERLGIGEPPKGP